MNLRKANIVKMASKPLPKGLQESLDNTKVEYRRLGKSGLKISVPIFGCMSFGDPKFFDWVIQEEEVCLAGIGSPSKALVN